MQPLSDATSPRKPRADGERNRSRLIDAAKAVFAEQGGAASLDRIARDAGVGIGTLYRHFPTRDALVEAVYRQETEALIAAAASLSAALPPLDALRGWLLLFVDFVATKQGMADALNTLIGGTEALYNDSTTRVAQSFEALVAASAAAGDIRLTIEPLDLLRAIYGVAHMNPGRDWKPSALQMVDVLLNGLRHGA